MKPTIWLVGLVVPSIGLALPQASTAPTAQQMLSEALAHMRGMDELIDRPEAATGAGQSVLWFAANGNLTLTTPTVSGVRDTYGRSPAGTVSVKRLQHRVPKMARQAYEKARKLSRKKDFEKSAQELERAVALDPDFAEAHSDLGVAYSRLGRDPEAAGEFRRAIDLAPEESVPHANLAWVLFSMDQRAEAHRSVQRALQLSPDNAPAHLLMGRLLIETPENLAQGLPHLEYAARSLPEARKMLKALNKK